MSENSEANGKETLNQISVHDAAAYLFWTLAESIGVAEANNAVVESAGQCLLEQPFTAAVLRQYGFEKVPHEFQRKFGNAIAAEAERFAIDNKNMHGVIYADDAQNGRSPSARHVQTASLRKIPRSVSVHGSKIEKIGCLCLRHPLPAVVFSDTKPHRRLLEIADTSTALGFHLPMFLFDATFQQVNDDRFISKGVFYIPVPDKHHGSLWGMVIQNSIRFAISTTFTMESGTSVVNIQW